jgi:Leucine-rich repeat (LRR) protein
MADFKDSFQKIETWNSKTIKTVLSEAEQNADLLAAITARYQALLNLIDGKNISDISKLPVKLNTSKVLLKSWEPNAISIEILEKIPLEEIQLKKIKVFPEWITYLKGLERLRLLECKNLSFPETMHRMTALSEIICYDCQLKQVPEQFRGLTGLRVLSLTKNIISEIPDWISELPLTELDLAFNKISKISSSIGGLSNLNKLSIQYNLVSSFPEEIGKLQKLEYIEIGGNKRLSALPEAMSALINMQFFNISSCNFTELPEIVKQYKKLKNLEISLNPIDEIPDWVGDLKELKVLELANTSITKLPATLLNLPELYLLDIRETTLRLKDTFSYSMDKAIVKSYLKKLFAKEEDPIAVLYNDLESRDANKMEAALKQLKAEPKFWNRAEKRYLSFIQIRLNSSKATLSDFAKAMLTVEEEAVLMKTGVKDKRFISFHYFDAVESKLLIDFIGALVNGLINAEEFCKNAAAAKTESELIDYSQKFLSTMKKAFTDEAAVSTEGWFSHLYAAFAGMDIFKVMYDHSSLGDDVNSKFSREFMIYIGAFSALHQVDFDVFQSDAPNLTEVFWMLPFIPRTIWGDTDPEMPKSILSFQRSAQMKIGDFGNWETFSSK